MLSGVRWLSARAPCADLSPPPSTLPLVLLCSDASAKCPSLGMCVCVCVCVWWVQAPCNKAYLRVQVVLARCVSIRDQVGSVLWAVSTRTSIGFPGLLHQRTTTWGLKQQTPVPSVRQLEVEPKVSSGLCFLGLPGEELPCLSQTLVAAGSPWLVAVSLQSLPLSLHNLFLQALCVSSFA